jgi:hypothetical protein
MNRKSLLTIFVTLVIVGLLGCPKERSISDVLADPNRYYNDDVVVTGTVVESWGLMGVGAFEIDDGTGKLWVLPGSKGIPGKGTRVSSKGRIQSGISLGGRSFAVVLRENDRKNR